MSKLLIKPLLEGEEGKIHSVTPETAGWKYVGFEAHLLKKGRSIAFETGTNEACAVILSGRADVSTRTEAWEGLGERNSVFDGVPPASVYVPNGDQVRIRAVSDCEVAVCLAPGFGNHPCRLIDPAGMSLETRGKGANTRHICNILPETEPADSLLVVEVITPAGNWSSYPPHKHDRDNLPHESFLEETYYHRLNPDRGYGVQRVFNDDLSLNETMAVCDRDVVLVPEGYHPYGVPYGYEGYYLNVMAGPKRVWKFHNHPDHAWLMNL